MGDKQELHFLQTGSAPNAIKRITVEGLCSPHLIHDH